MSPRKDPDGAIPWHARPADDVIDQLATRPAGLAREEAAERLAIHGANRLRPPHRRGPLLRLLSQFHNVLIYVSCWAPAW